MLSQPWPSLLPCPPGRVEPRLPPASLGRLRSLTGSRGSPSHPETSCASTWLPRVHPVLRSFYRVPAQGVGGTSCSEAFPRSSPRAAVGRWRRTGRFIGSDNILCRALELPAGTALWVHFRRPHPPQLLVYLEVQPGAAHCAWLRVSLPAGFLQAFTSGPPSSSPALHRGAVVVTHLGFPGFPLVPMSLCPANHRCLCLAYNQWEVGGRRAEWLCPVGGTGRAMSGAGEQLGVPRCCPTGRG